MTELLPCPFCGGNSIELTSFGHEDHYAECEDCNASGPVKSRDSKAAISWNTRAIASPEPSNDGGFQNWFLQPAIQRIWAGEHPEHIRQVWVAAQLALREARLDSQMK